MNSPLRRLRYPAAFASALLVLALGLAQTACESTRPGTLTSTRERFEEANRMTLVDQYQWQGWPRVDLVNPEHAMVHRHNWTGIRDASAIVAVDVFGDRLSIVGQVRDDHPLEEPFAAPRRPSWWEVPYAGDAVEVRFVPMENFGAPVTVLVKFGSAATKPELVILEAPEQRPGPLSRSVVRWQKTPIGYEFAAQGVGLDKYGLRPFWSLNYRLEVTLHDYDGQPGDYSALKSFTVTKVPESMQ